MLEIRNISVYADGQQLLKDVSLTVPEGSTTVLIGGSGSGKSLLLKTMSYIRPPDSGRIIWDDINLARISDEVFSGIRKQWGFMFQDSALWANMSVYENLALPVRFHCPELSEAEVHKRVLSAADMIGFEGNLRLRPVAFSAGKQKILSFLRSIVNDPWLLFLDEPSTFIDRSAFNAIHRVLRRYRREQRTIVMVTHEIDLARSLGDYLVIVRSGEIAAHGPLHELLESPEGRIKQEIIESFQQEDQE